ncbi:MAG: DM13 domain-containing protein, partial [Acidimicrobiales bacterium]
QPQAAPRWEALATFSGTGPSQTQPFFVGDRRAVQQWRANWTCQTATLRVTTSPPPARGGPLLDVACPGNGRVVSIQEGELRLAVEASGPWALMLEQEVTSAINEPLLAGMAGAPVVRQGSFNRVEKPGSGTATLYRLPSGERALRLDPFEVATNTDLFIWLSEAADPRTSADAVAVPRVVLAELKSTLGPQNYLLPADLPTERVRSVIIWCEPVRVAYIAAALS